MFNKKYGKDINFTLKRKLKSNLPPLRLRHALSNRRIFKLINAGKNG